MHVTCSIRRIKFSIIFWINSNVWYKTDPFKLSWTGLSKLSGLKRGQRTGRYQQAQYSTCRQAEDDVNTLPIKVVLPGAHFLILQHYVNCEDIEEYK